MTKCFKTQRTHQHQKNKARITQVNTPHGQFTTPAFMPVATRAYVNLMTPEDLQHSQSEIILGGNTYHMLCQPGLEIIESQGGMHPFMNWHGPMLTDSGGFQVFSLSKEGKLCKINEEGARFKHPIDGRTIELTPTSSMQAQKIIGADIIMAFDQCTPQNEDKRVAIKAMERTHRWLLESIDYHQQNPNTPYGNPQALFGIIQGGEYRDLREQSAEFVLQQPLDGIAIGGESIGFDMAKTVEILNWIEPDLPQHKLRYTMGVGAKMQDLLDVVKAGVDVFDCVAPTRNARHGALYHGAIVPDDHWLNVESTEKESRLLIKKAIYAKDERPICEHCECYTCQHYSRSYLHYLFKTKANSYLNLASIHNVSKMQQTCQAMRQCILMHSKAALISETEQ